MLTVSQLAKRFNISRTTILYYERQGLLHPSSRSGNGYRWYGEKEVRRLEYIVAYRSYGLSVKNIAALLDKNSGGSQSKLLKEHFNQLEAEIGRLKDQQRAIVSMLQEPSLSKKNALTKQRWVEIMQASGFSETAMTDWHRRFEEMEPEEHRKFLKSLGMDNEEIQRIRAL